MRARARRGVAYCRETPRTRVRGVCWRRCTYPWGPRRPVLRGGAGTAVSVLSRSVGIVWGSHGVQQSWESHAPGETSASQPGQPAMRAGPDEAAWRSEGGLSNSTTEAQLPWPAVRRFTPKGGPSAAPGCPWPFMPSSTREYAWLGGTPLVVPPSVGVGGPRRHGAVGPLQCQLHAVGVRPQRWRPSRPSSMCGDVPVGDRASVSACAFPKMETSPIIHPSCHIWQVILWELTAAEATLQVVAHITVCTAERGSADESPESQA